MYELTPRSRDLPETLTRPKLLKKFPTFCGNRRFITAFKTAGHLSLSRARPIQSMPHPTSWRSILILSSHIRIGLPSCLLPSGFPTKTLYAPLLTPYVLHVLPISVFLTWSPEWYVLVLPSSHPLSIMYTLTPIYDTSTQCTHNVILRRFRVTIVAMEKL